MSTPVGEKVLGKYKLLSPDFRFFLPMISQQFGESGSRYTLSFPNLSIWKNDPCPKLLSLHIFFGVQFASGAGILGEEFLGKSTHLAGGSRSARHPSPREQRLSFFTLLNFSLVGVATLAALVWLLGDPLRLLLGWGAFSLVLVKVLLDYLKQMPQHSSHTHILIYWAAVKRVGCSRSGRSCRIARSSSSLLLSQHILHSLRKSNNRLTFEVLRQNITF